MKKYCWPPWQRENDVLKWRGKKKLIIKWRKTSVFGTNSFQFSNADFIHEAKKYKKKKKKKIMIFNIVFVCAHTHFIWSFSFLSLHFTEFP